MTRPKLSKRLQAIIDFVPHAHYVADIGCDHAYVAISLFSSHKADHVFGIDNKSEPLKMAQNNIERFKLSEHITLLKNPIMKLKEPVDGCIIAGVGKESAIAMLDEFEYAFHDSTWICIQVNAHLIDIRQHMKARGYRLINETTVHDKKFYVILLYQRGIEPHDGAPLLIGPYLILDKENHIEYLQFLKQIASNFRMIAQDFSKQSMYSIIDDYLQGIL